MLRALIPPPLFVAVALGAGGVYYVLQDTLVALPARPVVPEGPPEVTAPPPPVPLQPQALDTVTDEQRLALLETPLFSATRSPAFYVEEVFEPEPEPEFEPEIIEEPVIEEPVVEPPQPPALAMLGVIRSDGVDRVLLAAGFDGVERWYTMGDQIDGWEIVEIATERVRLTQLGIDFVVNLER